MGLRDIYFRKYNSGGLHQPLYENIVSQISFTVTAIQLRRQRRVYARRKLRVRSVRIGLELRRDIHTARRCGSWDILNPLLPVSVVATLQPYIGGISRFLLSPRMDVCNRKSS